MEWNYKIEGNEYVLFDNKGAEVLRSSYKIALCYFYDHEDQDIKGTLLKHGNTEYVEKYFNQSREKYIKSGLNDFAENLKFVSGRIPVEELNKCIQITGYIGILHEKLISGNLSVEESVHPDFDEF